MSDGLRSRDDTKELLEAFDRSFIIDSYAQALNKEPPPAIIYHYTNGDGLRGIFETGNLWCTDIFHLNDISEIRHGVAHACDLLIEAASSRNATDTLHLFAKTVTKKLRENIEESANYFVCCFSKDGDDLGQWRAYADDGRGFAIGFDAGPLERAFAEAGPQKHSTYPLSYDEDKLRDMQARLVTEATSIISKVGSGVTPRFLTDLSVRLSVHVIHCSIYFKHAGYRNEQEYRFMQVHRGDLPVENLRIRTKPYSLIRYCEFNWKRKAAQTLREVVIGPAADAIEANKFVEDCRRSYLSPTHALEVRRSKIPYRSSTRNP